MATIACITIVCEVFVRYLQMNVYVTYESLIKLLITSLSSILICNMFSMTVGVILSHVKYHIESMHVYRIDSPLSQPNRLDKIYCAWMT